ncbi:hypothetical protein NDU88_006805, partial [Pleurodeles waltl]
SRPSDLFIDLFLGTHEGPGYEAARDGGTRLGRVLLDSTKSSAEPKERASGRGDRATEGQRAAAGHACPARWVIVLARESRGFAPRAPGPPQSCGFQPRTRSTA